MKILAFESSCDETAVAVVEDGRRVLLPPRLRGRAQAPGGLVRDAAKMIERSR